MRIRRVLLYQERDVHCFSSVIGERGLKLARGILIVRWSPNILMFRSNRLLWRDEIFCALFTVF